MKKGPKIRHIKAFMPRSLQFVFAYCRNVDPVSLLLVRFTNFTHPLDYLDSILLQKTDCGNGV